MTPEIITFGCRLNAYESEVMRAHARDAGLDDAVIVNTCAVTAEAARQARQAIRKVRRERPEARIIVTGCAAQIEPQRFAEMREVDHVIGNAEKLTAETFRALTIGGCERVVVNDIQSVRETAAHLIEGFVARARAYVQVQNGCDHRCTFCIIPFGRGPSRSVPAGEVVAQVRRLAENDVAEIVLTGVDMTSYGRDLPGDITLGKLVRKILRLVPELPRLRLSSIDSIEADDALVDAFAGEERLMPHLHLSLQSGDDLTLKRMKRRHDRAHAISFCGRLRDLRPDIVFGADLIAGFPTESDAMFENSLKLVEDCGLTYLHVFPYSPRPGTPASRMPQVAKLLVKARAERLRRRGEEALLAHFGKQLGKEIEVLMEKSDFGRARDHTPIRVAGDASRPGSLMRARVETHDRNALSGVCLS